MQIMWIVNENTADLLYLGHLYHSPSFCTRLPNTNKIQLSSPDNHVESQVQNITVHGKGLHFKCVRACACVCLCVFVCVYVCVHVCAYVCVSVYILILPETGSSTFESWAVFFGACLPLCFCFFWFSEMDLQAVLFICLQRSHIWS